jgi:ABC-type transporter Mla MlaB component
MERKEKEENKQISIIFATDILENLKKYYNIDDLLT